MKKQISCFIGSNEYHYLNNLRRASSNKFSAGDIVGYALRQLEMRDIRDVLSGILFEGLDNQTITDSMSHVEIEEPLQDNQTITDSMSHVEIEEPLQDNQTITDTMIHTVREEPLQDNKTITDSMSHVEIEEPLQDNQTITDSMSHVEIEEPQYLKLPELDIVILKISQLHKSNQERANYLNENKIYNVAKPNELWTVKSVREYLNNAKNRIKK